MVRMQETGSLRGICRWYVYALHGLLCEIIFTSSWDFATTCSWKLSGVSSVWAFFIYGTAIFIIEKMFLHLQTRCHLWCRCLIYTLWAYLWEFSTGYILKALDACPWDYSHFSGNIMGLITMEYAVPWFFGCMIVEQVVIKNTLKLQLTQDGNPKKHKEI
ncbi:transmembrane protein 229B [Mixophyes fleayi]|uniref:transmembrane protein 229B n=1 Tax=Mixophyes fleayi TaxID=3061075 RepID=UPI003F4D7E13